MQTDNQGFEVLAINQIWRISGYVTYFDLTPRFLSLPKDGPLSIGFQEEGFLNMPLLQLTLKRKRRLPIP